MSLNRDPALIQIINDQVKTLRKRTTKAEKILWEELRNRKFLGYKFYRQYPVIYDLLGYETFYVLDFYCHERKVAVELDGEIHKFKIKNDRKRENILVTLGIRVMRFKNFEIENDINNVLKKLQEFM